MPGRGSASDSDLRYRITYVDAKVGPTIARCDSCGLTTDAVERIGTTCGAIRIVFGPILHVEINYSCPELGGPTQFAEKREQVAAERCKGMYWKTP